VSTFLSRSLFDNIFVTDYQGLTRNFRHGTIFCSSITARLVNMKLGVPLEKLHTLPLNERVKIDNCHVTLMEANHCPGAVMFLFEPEGAKVRRERFWVCSSVAQVRFEIGIDFVMCVKNRFRAF
jgi:hypothetical protein